MKLAMQADSLKKFLYTLAGLAGISLIVLVHEAGHFLFAKLFNVPTPTFSVGFGPTLFAFPIGETIFKIALFPFGGYVKMDEAILIQQNYIPKILILLGGILFNLIFAYCILFYYALRNNRILTSIIDSVSPDSPAAKSGLQSGDIIIAYNHQPINANPDIITKSIATAGGKTIVLTIERNGIEQEVSIPLNMEHPLFGKNAGWLGIELKKKQPQNHSLLTSLQEGHKKFATTTQDISQAIASMVTKKDHQNILLGPIGIIAMIGKSLAINPQFYWFILALLSLNIGLFNILPLPFLDGGKALIVTIETIIGKTIPANILWVISAVFLALFLLFITQITMSDIKRLIKK